MSLFQGILIGVFIVAIIGGVILFGIVQNNDGGTSGLINVWGTVPQEVMGNLLTTLSADQNSTLPKIAYQYVPEETFDRTLLEALASGTGPDVVLLPHEDILKQKTRLLPIPYKSVSERTYKDLFIEDAEVFLDKDGILAMPFSVNPLVLYWNRTMFTKAGIANPPKYWDEVIQIVPRLSEKDASGILKKSGIALGEFSNIDYAKDIIALLFMQSGSPIVGDKNGRLSAFIDERGAGTVTPSDTAITFFTQFANPVKTLYSWSRSFPNSLDMFAQGDVAMVIGRASDITKIQEKNPNLNFDVAELPVPKPSGEDTGGITFGSMYGLAIVKNSTNPSGALNAMYGLTSAQSLGVLANITNLPPVRRDMLADFPEDPYKEVFYKASLRSKVWYDPDKDITYGIFKNLLDTIVSGRESITGALKQADEQLNDLLDRIQPQTI